VTVKINAPVTPQPQYYPVEAIELDRTEWTLKVGESAHRLQANIKPEYATNKQVIWESTNPIVATVDATGVVTPLQPGATTIRVTTLDGNKTAECVVKVLAASSEVTGVELDSHELVLKTVGAKKKLKAKVLPGNATNQKVTWKSSNQKVAKVDENGVVTAVSSGEATITVTTEDGGNTDTCLVLVPSKDIVRLEVSELNMLMKPAASAKLQVYAVDQRGKKTNIASHKLTRIVSSDSDIVTVKRSTIKAGNEAGDAILTITHQGHKIQVKVKVSTISVTTLTPSSETVSLKSGKSEQLEVKASMSDDSEQDVTALATWSSSNAEIVKVSAGGKLTAKKAGKATIKAVYGGKTVTITVTVTRK
ncbi:MAG: Ig-like domain-containing protein, partial [Clostridia bacterium]